MHTEMDVHAYVQDLERYLQLSLFGGGMTNPEGAVLLVRGALAEGDEPKAAWLAGETQQLTVLPDPIDARGNHLASLPSQPSAESARPLFRTSVTRPRGRRCPGRQSRRPCARAAPVR